MFGRGWDSSSAGAAKLLSELEAPGRPGRHHFWQRRFYDFDVWSEKKKLEKREYMHMNPVERGLVRYPAEWPWSSYRFYSLGETRVLAMDRWPPEARRPATRRGGPNHLR